MAENDRRSKYEENDTQFAQEGPQESENRKIRRRRSDERGHTTGGGEGNSRLVRVEGLRTLLASKFSDKTRQ